MCVSGCLSCEENPQVSPSDVTVLLNAVVGLKWMQTCIIGEKTQYLKLKCDAAINYFFNSEAVFNNALFI